MDFVAYIPRSTYNSIKTIIVSMVDDNSYDNIGIYVRQNFFYNYDSFSEQFGWATSIF